MAASPLFLLATLLSLAAGLGYGYVGWRLSRRRVEGPSHLASSLFSAWWAAIAVAAASGALVRLAVVQGWMDLPLYLTYLYLGLLLVCLALWALLYYLVYLLTGSRRALVPITIYYAMLFLAYVYLVTSARPESLTIEGSRIVLSYAREHERAALLGLSALTLGPQIAASIGYFRLLFKVEGPTARYRIGLVSATIFAWFLSSVLATATEVNASEWWLFASGAIGMGASVVILMAYVPPRWVRARYGVASIDEAEPA